MAKLTEAYVAKLSVPKDGKETVVHDDALPSFGVRVQPATARRPEGTKSYFVKFRIGAAYRRQSLGAALPGTLKKARERAGEILYEARHDRDLVREDQAKAAKRVAEEQAAKKALTLATAAPLFMADRIASPKPLSERWRETMERQLRACFLPFRDRLLDDISTRELEAHGREISKGMGPRVADQAMGTLSLLYVWAMRKGAAKSNPTIGIENFASTEGRARFLSPVELTAVWRACSDDGDHSRIVRLLMLTGQRREEIGSLKWSEINFEKRQIELPANRTKNNRAHIVPLSSAALAVLQATHRRVGRDFVFGAGEGAFSGWSACKRRLDERLGIAIGDEWRLHDLRRSVVTHMAEEGLADPHVIEAVVNHVSGHKGGVAGVYNRASYAKEKRFALDRWADMLGAWIDGCHPSNVVRLETAGSK